jgi:cysteine desulfurase
MAHSSLRFGLGRFTTEAEVDYVVQKMVGIVHRLREMRYGFPCPYYHSELPFVSPLWEMVQEGIDISTIDWSQAQH